DTGNPSAGDDTYPLPAGAGWSKLGNPPGSKGFKYKGAKTLTDPCAVAILKTNVVKAVCKGAAVTLNAPFTGEVGVILTIGTDKKRYCASSGGDDVDNASGTLIRKKADAPLACPTVSTPPPPPSPCACGTPDPGMLSFRTAVGSGPCGVVLDNSCASALTL